MNSYEKLIRILKRFGDPPYEMGITELSREMGVSKSGIHKIIRSLVRESLLVQNPSTRKYSLGPLVFRLGNVYSDSKGIWDVSHTIMHSLADRTGASVLIGIREGDDPILAYKLGIGDKYIYQGQTGSRFPFNAGALGKLLTAFLPEDRIRRILKTRNIEKKTPYTETDPEKLMEEYWKIKKQGYAVSIEENLIGAFGMAAPIRDRHGNVWACLSLVGPKETFTPDVVDLWLSLLRNGADEISSRLGFRGV